MTNQAEAATTRADEGEEWREALRPRLPGEGLSFDEIASGYHFGTIEDRRRLFTHMILHEVDRRQREGETNIVCLDIGCGRGIGRSIRYQRAVHDRADEFWGIEPDASVVPEEGLFHRYENALMETSDLPAGSVDVAYSFMVLEHVADPKGYLRAVHRALKPGGAHLFMTVNGAHYFTRMAKAMHTLRIDELVLKVVQRSSDDYHYPVAYLANNEAQVVAAAGEGWESIDFAYSEADAPSPYLPGPLAVIARRAAAKRRSGRDPKILLNLACRMRKSRA
jgi:2-polyprenyl-3-methyl-5-hydroxy-6-metoxy-1,4-benzoquinol methylase